MAFYLSTVFLLSTVVAFATSQTFQYSRGWTNGKRAENSVLPGIPSAEFKLSGSSIQSSGARMMDVPTPCQLQKLKMLLQGNGNEQLYLLPCELLSVPRVSLVDFPMGHFRRGSTLESLLVCWLWVPIMTAGSLFTLRTRKTTGRSSWQDYRAPTRRDAWPSKMLRDTDSTSTMEFHGVKDYGSGGPGAMSIFRTNLDSWKRTKHPQRPAVVSPNNWAGRRVVSSLQL